MRTMQVKCDGWDKRADASERAMPPNWIEVHMEGRVYDLCPSCYNHWKSYAHPTNWPRAKA